MVSCETSESTSNPFVGIVLVLLACCCYAFGNCMQRYSLLKPPGELVFGIFNRNLGWLIGAIIYFSANGLYAVALSFAPVSVLAAVFSLTIVANAACARFLLGDTIPRMAYPGYALVLAGSVIFSVTVNAQVCHFDGGELVEVMTSASAIVYWLVLGLILLGGGVFAWRFEKANPIVAEEPTADHTAGVEQHDDSNLNDEEAIAKKEAEEMEQPIKDSSPASMRDPNAGVDGTTLLIARFVYPVSLGATEAVGALVLKAVNSLLTTIATDEEEESASGIADKDYPDDLGLWIGLIVVGLFLFIGIVLWLRLVYSRFEITGAFPVEFGMLTFASVVGGFMVFQDYNFITSAKEWVGVTAAGLCILGGILTVAYATWQAKVLAAAAASQELGLEEEGEGEKRDDSAQSMG